MCTGISIYGMEIRHLIIFDIYQNLGVDTIRNIMLKHLYRIVRSSTDMWQEKWSACEIK